MSLVEYQRTGGRAPANAELLAIEPDGTFTMRRIIGGSRVGSFAGELPAAGFKTLQKRIADAEGEAPEKTHGLPPQVLERIATTSGTVSFGREQKLPAKLRALSKQLRDLSESLTAHPTAALEMKLSADGSSVELSALGDRPLAAEFASATLAYDLFGEDEARLASGRAELPADLIAMQKLEPGWHAKLAFPADVDFNPKRTLQVRFTFALQGADAVKRQAQLLGVAGKGW